MAKQDRIVFFLVNMSHVRAEKLNELVLVGKSDDTPARAILNPSYRLPSWAKEPRGRAAIAATAAVARWYEQRFVSLHLLDV